MALTRSAGPASRGLLAAGSLLLAGTVAVIATEALRHLRTAGGPVLPVSWCRSAAMTVLPPLSGTRWLTSWQQDRVALSVVAGLALLYLSGVSAVRRRGGSWPAWRVLAFLAGLGVCLLATCSAIGVYDMALFSAHMLGHLALVMVAPALMVSGRPMTLALEATAGRWQARLRRLTGSRAAGLWFSPPVALAGYAVVIVGTHLTGLMDVIMARPWAGQLEHLAYLAVGYQFFALILGDEPVRWRLSMPAKQLLLAVAMAVDTFTGVILLQTTQAIRMTGSSPAHLDPLTETHLGGAIMWVGGDAVMAVVMIIVALAWLRLPEQRRRDADSWLEQARRATLAEHGAAHVPAGSAEHPVEDVDADDRARIAYNAWLLQLSTGGDDRGPGPRRPS